MRIIADTNLLVRFIVKDDEAQFNAVCRLFAQCKEIMIPTHVLCELVWVFASAYKFKPDAILDTIEKLANSNKTNVCEDEAEAGLRMLRKGGDFADGVNAYRGLQMASGTAVFASFDQRAVRLLAEQGIATLIPQ